MNNVKRFLILTREYLISPIAMITILLLFSFFINSKFFSDTTVVSLLFAVIIDGAILGFNYKDLLRYMVLCGKDRKFAIMLCFLLNGLLIFITFMFSALIFVSYALITHSSVLYAFNIATSATLYFSIASFYAFLATAVFTLLRADWLKVLSMAIMIALPISVFLNKIRNFESSKEFIVLSIAFILLSIVFTFFSYNSKYSVVKSEH